MFEVIFLFSLALIWIIFAVVQDVREKEIADWLNFSLIVFALGFRFFWSLFNVESVGFSFFYQGLIGLGIFFVLENLLYYSRMFGGGDAKLMLALGAVLPIFYNFKSNLEIFVLFFVLFLFVGGIYGILFSFILSFRNWKKFELEFSRQFRKNKSFIFLGIFLAILFLVFSFYVKFFLFFGILVFAMTYLYLYLKSVDESCMVRKVSSKNLREGDWIYENVKVGNKVIKSSWDGLTKKDISLLKKNKKFVLLKEGIFFAPVFLISFLLTFIFVWLGLWNSFW